MCVCVAVCVAVVTVEHTAEICLTDQHLGRSCRQVPVEGRSCRQRQGFSFIKRKIHNDFSRYVKITLVTKLHIYERNGMGWDNVHTTHICTI